MAQILLARYAYKEMNKSKMDRYCCQQNVKWILIASSVSRMGGAWERIIRYIRKILTALIGSQTLNHEELITFMTKIEAMLNS